MRDQARAIIVATESLGSLLIIIFLAALATSSTVIYIQFAARITGSVASTGYVQTIATMTTLVVFALSTLLSGRASDDTASCQKPSSRNGLILTGGLAVCAVGMFVMGFGQSIVTLIIGWWACLEALEGQKDLTWFLGLMIKAAGSCYAGAQMGLVAAKSGEEASATKLFAATALASQIAGISGSFLFTKLYGFGLGMHNSLGNALPYVVASVSNTRTR